MNIIDFTKGGGYRLKQFTFRKMQEAYMQILKMFIAFCNVPEAGNYIIQGCQINGANITSGYLYIDGELCYFAQSAGTLATKIRKNIVIQDLGFKNGNSENVFRFTNAVTDPTEGADLNSFIRVSPVFDPNYTHTDNNFTTALQNKLNGIEALAQKNVIPDWDENNPLAPRYIANKPTEFLKRLHFGTAIIGDISDNTQNIREITMPDVGTDNYIVVGEFTGMSNLNQHTKDNDVTWAARDKTRTAFKLSMDEYSPEIQNLVFNYLIIELV